jgi:phage-related protein
LRPAIFHPHALQTIRSFPSDARKALGEAVLDLQRGVTLGMPLSRTMTSVATGAHEIRVKDESGAYRAFYFMKSQRGIFVFHAFRKMSRQTSRHDIDLGRRRLKEMLREEG